VPDRLTTIARKLRKDATNAERRLWQRLRREQVEGCKFRRQVVLSGFIVDFACYEAQLVVEVDGATHSTDAEIARDATRDAVVRAQGYAILRFTNDEVYHNLDGVLETVRLKLIALRPPVEAETFDGGATPLPNPQGGRERPRGGPAR
jgi:very-short-patch-repair endonuclease